MPGFKRWSYSKTLLSSRGRLFRADFFVVFLSVALTFFLRYNAQVISLQASMNTNIVVLSMPIYWLISLRFNEAWSLRSIENLQRTLVSILRSGIQAVILVGFTAYALHDQVSRIWMGATSLFITAGLLANRLVVNHLFIRELKTSSGERYILVAKESQIVDFDKLPVRHPGIAPTPSFFRVAPPAKGDSELWLANLARLIQDESYDGIIICTEAITEPRLISEISKLYYLGISVVLLSTPLATEIKLFKQIPFKSWVRIQEPKIVNSGFAVKRIFDAIFAGVALITLSPILLLISVAIKFTSPGPVLYVAKRRGAHGNLFNFYKFRSMVNGADKQRATMIGSPDEQIIDRYLNDTRITNLGRFLRRWSLDELPQLWCVLVGTMSVVGPRPILTEEDSLVNIHSQFRSIVKPGLTGLWQVSGRKEVAWEDRMDMDLEYIQNWSFKQDMVLIGKTFASISSGKGSY